MRRLKAEENSERYNAINTNPSNYDEERICYALRKPARKAQYAIAQGAYTSSNYSVGGKETCWWWLRSPGIYSDIAAYVSNVGSVDYDGVSVDRDKVAVRPALWIDLGS